MVIMILPAIIGCANIKPFPMTLQNLDEDPMVTKYPWETYNSSGITVWEDNATIEVTVKEGNEFYDGQIYKTGFKLKPGGTYKVIMEIETNNPTEISMKFHKASPDWNSFQTPEFSSLTFPPGTSTQETMFTSKTGKSARLSIYYGANMDNTKFKIKKIQVIQITT